MNAISSETLIDASCVAFKCCNKIFDTTGFWLPQKTKKKRST
jgi:hypothetical protein